ncbi:MAG: hypothetical protein DRN20_03750 [Thermoplasmata archaeon]|nr:MAG: hypothetical protein DRN20_03750 [Thermoplasmata archaeon]
MASERKYRIPGEDIVVDALTKVLKEAGAINSQRLLREIVLNEIRKIDPSFRLSEKRLRMIAINSGVANVDIHCRESEKRAKMSRCPVCGSKLYPVKNKTIFGGTVTVGKECRVCGYWTGIKTRMPMRYVFTPK